MAQKERPAPAQPPLPRKLCHVVLDQILDSRHTLAVPAIQDTLVALNNWWS